jgi:transposase-like protein
MKCPKCESEQIRKNGHRSDKQNYLCKICGRQFVESYSQRGYSDDAKQICLKMHQNGLGFREIERLTGISHNTIINWAKQAGLSPDDSEINELHIAGQTLHKFDIDNAPSELLRRLVIFHSPNLQN